MPFYQRLDESVRGNAHSDLLDASSVYALSKNKNILHLGLGLLQQR